MTFVVLFVLAVVWAVYLASWLRNRSEHRSVNSISSFSRHLSVLERATPGGRQSPLGRTTPSVGGPLYRPMSARSGMSLSTARRRRRDVLFALGGAVVVTLMLAVVAGGPFVWLQALTDLLFVSYLVLLVRTQRLAAERRAKVTYLGPAIGGARPQEPAYVLASASSGHY